MFLKKNHLEMVDLDFNYTFLFDVISLIFTRFRT